MHTLECTYNFPPFTVTLEKIKNDVQLECLPRAVDHASLNLYLSRLLKCQLCITTPNWAFYKNIIIQFLSICQKQFVSLYKLNYIEILTLHDICVAIFCCGIIR